MRVPSRGRLAERLEQLARDDLARGDRGDPRRVRRDRLRRDPPGRRVPRYRLARSRRTPRLGRQCDSGSMLQTALAPPERRGSARRRSSERSSADQRRSTLSVVSAIVTSGTSVSRFASSSADPRRPEVALDLEPVGARSRQGEHELRGSKPWASGPAPRSRRPSIARKLLPRLAREHDGPAEELLASGGQQRSRPIEACQDRGRDARRVERVEPSRSAPRSSADQRRRGRRSA